MKILFNFIFSGYSKNDKKRIFKNIFSQININVIRTILQLAFPPLMIFSYNLETFGVWIFLVSIPSVLNIFNFNLNEASKIEMSLNYNKKNYKKINKIFNNSIVLTIFIIVFLNIISVLFIKFYNFDLKILKSISTDLKYIVTFIFVAFFLDILNSIFVNSITFYGRIDINGYLEIFFDFLGKFLLIISGIIYEDLFIASILFMTNNILKILIYYLYFLNTSKYLEFFNFKLFSKNEIFRLLKLSIPHYLETINFIIRNTLQVALLGIFFGGQVVGMISALKTLFFYLPIRVWGILSKSLLFEFTKTIALKKTKLLNKILKKISYITIIFSLIFIILSYLFGEKVFDLWLNDSYKVNYVLIMLICVDIVLMTFGSIFKLVGKSVNQYLPIMKIDLIISISIIVISSLFFLYYKNYYFIFILNIVGSFMYIYFSLMNYFKIVKKIS
jgi:O-antigen/teichoic acid export membrane protein